MADIKSNNDEFWWLVLLLWCKQELDNWDRLRNKKELSESDFVNYYSRFFANDIPNFILQKGTPLFRARRIKSDDFSKIGVNRSEVMEEYCEIVFSDAEKKLLEQYNNNEFLNFSPELILFLKCVFGIQIPLTEAQQQELEQFKAKYSSPKVYGFSEKDSRVPPCGSRKEGRMNTEKDSYLYLAFDKSTAIQEMRPSIGQCYSLAEFRSKRDLKIADLTGKDSCENSFIFFISNKISEPNTEDDVSFYKITQYMAHMIKEHHFDGIMYKSALNQDKNNILLFDEYNADFIASEVITINGVSVDYSTVFSLNDTML